VTASEEALDPECEVLGGLAYIQGSPTVGTASLGHCGGPVRPVTVRGKLAYPNVVSRLSTAAPTASFAL
jgi:hypothetical protein